MKKLLSILAVLTACIVVLFAATKSEMRMYVHLQDAKKAWSTAVKDILTITFQDVQQDTATVSRMNIFHSSDATNGHFAVDSIDSVRFQRNVVKYDVVKDGALITTSFKVSDKRSVYFSQGNLQFNAAEGAHATADSSTLKGTWRFAENQYDFIGSGNTHAAEDYDGWIDLFGWGTSGWNSGATAYQPWSVSENSTDYTPQKDASLSLSGTTANADWGLYNAISNGGNQPNLWRTLTTDEWQYLLTNYRSTLAKIGNDSTLCLLIFPEKFQAPNNLEIKVLSDGTTSKIEFEEEDYADNFFTIEEFAELERLGVVALPSTTRRIGEKVILGSVGHYWSSTAQDEKKAGKIQFYNSAITPNSSTYRHYGLSVRLVYDLNFRVIFKDYDGTVVLDTVVTRGVVPTCTEPQREDVGQRRYTFNGWDKEVEAATSDVVYTATYDSSFVSKEDGKLFRAVYKVSDTKKVYFSQGNLQYNGELNKWRFAENQYDFIGEDNKNVAEKYNGWIDLFGWGSSSYYIEGKAYQPWATDTDYSKYGPADNNNLTGDYDRCDWAYYNPIINGGNSIFTWRTLTYDEWVYLLDHYDWAMGKVGENNTLCLMLIPDDFQPIDGVTITPLVKNKADWSFKFTTDEYEKNVYSEDEFKKLEEAGVVAFPCSGSRKETEIRDAGLIGMYWTTTAVDNDQTARSLVFNETRVATMDYFRNLGFAVRPVYELNFDATFLNDDGALLKKVTVNRGETPDFGGIPAKDGLLEYDYTFTKWNKTILPLKQDAVYTAIYDSTRSVKKKGLITRNAIKVSDTKTVYFSQGNLQFNAATNDWRFATNQYETLGTKNDSVREGYDGYIDLFGWGTSGWNSGATAYQPWSTSSEHNDYIDVESLTGDNEKADWAIYNTISNGTTEADFYRTLTNDEWKYMLSHNKWTVGKVGDDKVLCIMIFPSDFEKADDLTVKMLSDNITGDTLIFTEEDYAENVYTAEDFPKLEEIGVVAFPTTGSRAGTKTSGTDEYGIYWTTTTDKSQDPYCFEFNATVGIEKPEFQHYGCAVRPVHDLTVDIQFVNYDGTPLYSYTTNYGEPIVYSGETPTKISDFDYTYSFSGWDPIVTPAHRNIVYTAKFDKKARTHIAFKISDNDSVYFSMGNLQYNAGDGKTHETADGGTAQGTFRFADNQYDYVGSDNSKASSTYNGWIDLFKYGTSGWNNGEDNYQPWTNTDNGTFLDENLSGKYANADWGVYNAISNGGETGSTPKVWRTLSKTELEYILTHYDWTLADVGENKTLCLLILPANFTSPFTLRILKPLEQGFIELTYYNSSIDETIHSDNALTLSQFQQLEDKGVIAFPNVGNIKFDEDYSTEEACYWTSTTYKYQFDQYALGFDVETINTGDVETSRSKLPVRLVRDAK